MIIAILIILAILFFVTCNLLVKNRTVHLSASIISSILICLAVGLVVANFKYHYGMHLRTVSCTRSIKPMNSQAKLLIKQPLGTKKQYDVIVYKANGKMKHTGLSDKVTNKIKLTNHQNAKLVTKNRKWEYKNCFYKSLFNLAMKPKKHSTTNIFYIPKSWIIMNKSQAKNIKKNAKVIAKQQKAQMQSPMAKQAMQTKIQQGVQAKMMSNPKLAMATPQQKQALMKKLAKQAENKMKAQAKVTILQKAVAEAKQNK